MVERDDFPPALRKNTDHYPGTGMIFARWDNLARNNGVIRLRANERLEYAVGLQKRLQLR
jgi:hypothetical protein